MSEPITPESSARICNHMNDDHQDAVDSYVKNYGTSAKMTKLTPTSMEITVEVPFDHVLQDCSDAKKTLVNMIK
jgi:putative heme iron utilization protein